MRFVEDEKYYRIDTIIYDYFWNGLNPFINVCFLIFELNDFHIGPRPNNWQSNFHVRQAIAFRISNSG